MPLWTATTADNFGPKQSTPVLTCGAAARIRGFAPWSWMRTTIRVARLHVSGIRPKELDADGDRVHRRTRTAPSHLEPASHGAQAVSATSLEPARFSRATNKQFWQHICAAAPPRTIFAHTKCCIIEPLGTLFRVLPVIFSHLKGDILIYNCSAGETPGSSYIYIFI